MKKWINERAWMVSVYMCYILGFIILSVIGYLYTLKAIGDTSTFMKIVLFVCVCLFVAMVIALVFAAFITPFSELLIRLLNLVFFRKANTVIPQINEDIEKVSNNNITSVESGSYVRDEDGSNITDIAPLQREALKREFMEKYVNSDSQELPIYDVFESLFNQQQNGAFVVRAFKCALSDPKWLKVFPGYEDAKRLFPQPDAIKGGSSNYSNANNERKFTSKIVEATKSLLKDKFKEVTGKFGKQEE